MDLYEQHEQQKARAALRRDQKQRLDHNQRTSRLRRITARIRDGVKSLFKR